MQNMFKIIADRSPIHYTKKAYLHHCRKSKRNSTQYNLWREKVLSRDNYKCSKCGSSENLQVHHIKQYVDNIFLRNKISNGITLCRDCHATAHPWNKKPVKYILRKAKKLSEGESSMCADIPGASIV